LSSGQYQATGPVGLFRAALASLTQTDRLGLSLDIDPMTML
jgi:hypothetical protein